MSNRISSCFPPLLMGTIGISIVLSVNGGILLKQNIIGKETLSIGVVLFVISVFLFWLSAFNILSGRYYHVKNILYLLFFAITVSLVITVLSTMIQLAKNTSLSMTIQGAIDSTIAFASLYLLFILYIFCNWIYMRWKWSRRLEEY